MKLLHLFHTYKNWCTVIRPRIPNRNPPSQHRHPIASRRRSKAGVAGGKIDAKSKSRTKRPKKAAAKTKQSTRAANISSSSAAALNTPTTRRRSFFSIKSTKDSSQCMHARLWDSATRRGASYPRQWEELISKINIQDQGAKNYGVGVQVRVRRIGWE